MPGPGPLVSRRVELGSWIEGTWSFFVFAFLCNQTRYRIDRAKILYGNFFTGDGSAIALFNEGDDLKYACRIDETLPIKVFGRGDRRQIVSSEFPDDELGQLLADHFYIGWPNFGMGYVSHPTAYLVVIFVHKVLQTAAFSCNGQPWNSEDDGHLNSFAT